MYINFNERFYGACDNYNFDLIRFITKSHKEKVNINYKKKSLTTIGLVYSLEYIEIA